MVVKKRKILTEKVIGRIKYYLKENETKRIKGLGKQQKRKVDIYEALISDSIQIGYTTVAQAVNAIKRKGREAYIKQEYGLPGVRILNKWCVYKNLENKFLIKIKNLILVYY